MFEFEKRIMKAEKRYPKVGIPYQVVPVTKKAKFCFAKSYKQPQRILSEREIKSHIEKYLAAGINQYPFTGELDFHADIKGSEVESEVKNRVIRNLAMSGVPGIEYADPSGTFKSLVLFSHLKYGTDFIIKIGAKITYEPPKKLTFADIKAL